MKTIIKNNVRSNNLVLRELSFQKSLANPFPSQPIAISEIVTQNCDEIKDDLNLLAKNLKLLQKNKDLFNKDIEKHIYLNDKNHLINLNILNFTSNSKYNFKNFSEAMKNILKSKVHKFEYF